MIKSAMLLDDSFFAPAKTQIAGTQRMKLRDIISFLESTYCGEIGYEYMHINSREKCMSGDGLVWERCMALAMFERNAW
jgi:hypothetical protein